MAIRFENTNDGKPSKREVGGKAYVAEEPSATEAEPDADLPFAKPVRAEKKGRKVRQK